MVGMAGTASVEDAADGADAADGGAGLGVAGGATRPGPQRILVVEDDAALRSLVAFALEDEGYAVDAAADGAAAERAVARHRPDLIVLDLWLSGPNGRVFAARYRSGPGPHAPIFVLSARPLSEVVAAAEAIGAAGFLRKPFDLEHLLTAVRRLVQVGVAEAAGAVTAG